MQAKFVPGSEGGNAVGQRVLFCFYASGKASYSNSTHDPVTFPPGLYMDAIPTVMSVSGTYAVRFKPSAAGTTRATWTAYWYVISTGAEANSADLSAEKIQFLAVGGGF